MSDQYPYREGDYPFIGSDGGQIPNDPGATSPGDSFNVNENASPHFEWLGDFSGQSLNFGDDSFFTACEDGHLSNITYSRIQSPEPEYATTFPADFSISDLTPYLEGNSYFTENVGEDLFYGTGEVVSPGFEDCDEARYPTDSSYFDEGLQLGDDSSVAGGASEQFSAADTEILEHAVYNAKAPRYSNTMPQSAVGPHNDHNFQNAPQSVGTHEIRPPHSSQANESPRKTEKRKRRTQSGDDYISGRPDPKRPNEYLSQPQKYYGRKAWSKEEREKNLELFNKGKTWGEIGKELGRTGESCRRQRFKDRDDDRIEADNNARKKAEACAPKTVPTLHMKDVSAMEGETPGQKGIDRTDWATRRKFKDKQYVDLETPGLKTWVYDRLKTIRDERIGGPWIVPWDMVAEDLNKAKDTNLKGKDLLAAMPY